jgi:hypothetical protein
LELERIHKLATDQKGGYTLESRLLKRHSKLVVAESVHTDLIIAVHCSLATAYPGKSKTKDLIKERYY